MAIFSEDTKQKINFGIKVASECFKVFMACLLSVFVPQNCEGEVCTFDQNFEDLSNYNSFVLAWNFLTLSSFIYLYWVDTRNEIWLINAFDQDRTKPDNYLSTDIKDYPEVLTKLKEHNQKVKNVYFFTTGLYIVNIVLSSVLVLYYYYYDIKTLTALITNSLLVVDKLINGVSISMRANNENSAISLYAKEPVLYNVIDKDLRRKLSVKQNITIDNIEEVIMEPVDINVDVQVNEIPGNPNEIQVNTNEIPVDISNNTNEIPGNPDEIPVNTISDNTQENNDNGAGAISNIEISENLERNNIVIQSTTLENVSVIMDASGNSEIRNRTPHNTD